MSEQLETIKCDDWTINFPGAVGGRADGGESPSVEAGGPPIFFVKSVPGQLWPGQPCHHPSVRPSKATGLVPYELALNSGGYLHSPN